MVVRAGEAQVIRAEQREHHRMIWNESRTVERRLRWFVLVPPPLALGALGWWLAGPVLAALLACWPVWIATTRWRASEQGVRVDDDGFDLIRRGAPIHRVRWADVTDIDVQRRVPGDDWAHLVVGRAGLLPVVPVVSLGDDRECVIWTLAVARNPGVDRIDEAEAIGLALVAAWEQARAAGGLTRPDTVFPTATWEH